MTFDEAIEQSGLNTALAVVSDLSPAGRPPITQEAANLAIAVAKLEPVSASLVSFSHLCEHSFEISPSLPNTNGHPAAIWTNEKTSWDIGPFQLNLQWIMRSICQGEINAKGLLWTEYFGSQFFEPDGITPCGFTGNAIANGRMAARKLLSVKPVHLGQDMDRWRAIKFTGPDHQTKRGQLYDMLMPSFQKFFTLYQP